MKHEKFANMKLKNGETVFLNTDYITTYGYIKGQDKTVVSVLGEGQELYYPGDQTREIRVSINSMDT